MALPLCLHRSTCRLCDSTDLERVVPYPPTAVADAYLAEINQQQPLFPLDLYLCITCGHVQLLDVVDPELLFREYTYETSVSLGLVEHFRHYSEAMIAYAGLSRDALVVEIGSNDGSLLKFFKAHGMRVLGVDPARLIAQNATASGIETWPEFFGPDVAARIHATHGKAALVAANNVFAHADNLGEVAEGIRAILAPDGFFVFEVSYLPDIVERLLFDTVYHEHLSYHSVRPLARFFHRHGLELIDFLRIPTKGGSFRGIARRTDGARPVQESVRLQAHYESAHGYDSAPIYHTFAAEMQRRKAALEQCLETLTKQGATVAGYGASATVTTLLYYFGIGRFLEYLVDDNPVKHHCFSPGLHLPVLPSSALYERRPDYTVVLAWNYAEPIMKRHSAYRNDGGKFILPLPELDVV